MAKYTVIQTIRKDVGSPTTTFDFRNPMAAIQVDNYGSTGVYGMINGTAVPAGSATFYVPAGESREFDVYASGVSLAPSGTTAVASNQIIPLPPAAYLL